jgi:hypothetical protein
VDSVSPHSKKKKNYEDDVQQSLAINVILFKLSKKMPEYFLEQDKDAYLQTSS